MIVKSINRGKHDNEYINNAHSMITPFHSQDREGTCTSRD